MPVDHPDVRDLETESTARIRPILGDVGNDEFLAAFHAEQNFSCGACHGRGILAIDAEFYTETCFTCHGSYEALAEITNNTVVAELNPHKSHLRNFDCSVCDHAHSRSRSYFLQCHSDFNMPRPEQKGKKLVFD